MWSVYQANLLKLKIEKSPTKLINLDTTSLGYILPGLTKTFGKDRPCKMMFKAVTPPTANITMTGIDLSGFQELDLFCRPKGTLDDVKAVTL